ncbi:hypothetical protein FGG08_001088 [Glutinoglossum americanum]|uniref:Alpha/beta hydrolase fold-3 domain-containing protein n=1 Tax=Glutinoglossum americanum TaxID=1670608 RepID=A0A9P8L5P4_9PEZI|nr:hypothetical protein FGG08_001088 [Glutinoglossum americanum]
MLNARFVRSRPGPSLGQVPEDTGFGCRVLLVSVPGPSVVMTLLWLYLARNFGKLLGLECPEPLANLYSRSYFRATWVTTALDAGFWTAMRIRRKWARDLLSVVFSLYYLIAAEQADEKVRKVRGMLTVDHLRVSWNKATTPYLSFFTSILRPRLMRFPPRAIRIPRPPESSYKEPVSGWLYFDGPISDLKNHTKVVLDIPGGGFVAMTPRNHDDKLLAWAGRLELPVLSLDYKKAPEHPYPYALNECYDVYHTLISSRGRCIGLSGEHCPKIVLTGDSAGGNLATCVTLMILQSGGDPRRWERGAEVLPAPEGLVLIYPGLDMNIGNWMTDEQMSLIRDRRVRKTNNPVLRRKSQDYSQLDPNTPHVSDDDEEPTSPPSCLATKQQPPRTDPTKPDPAAAHLTTSPTVPLTAKQTSQIAQSKPQRLKTRLAMSSMISYFNDRVLSPEMMRAMIILYVGPHHRPDFSTDFLLSPLLAPENLIARFPKTYFLTGERDPLVDDTVIFAGRIRQAKLCVWRQRCELGLESASRGFDERECVEVSLIPGISHGFLQFTSVFPDAWNHIFRCARWIEEIFQKGEQEETAPNGIRGDDYFTADQAERKRRHHHRVRTESSGEEDRPLEMSMVSSKSSGRSDNPTATTTNHPPSPPSASSSTQTTQPQTTTRAYSSPSGPPRAAHHRKLQQHLKANGNGKRGVGGRSRSMVSLASEEDLLGRRMQGLAGGLMGAGGEEEVETP